jgi:hypothetical protein
LAKLGVHIRDFESVDRIFLYRFDPLKAHRTNMQLRGLISADVTDTYGSGQPIQTTRS